MKSSRREGPLFTLIVDENIILRILSGRDAAPLFTITDQSRDYLKRWLPWVDDTRTVDDSFMFIKSSLEIYNRRTGMTAGIFLDEALVGVVGYNNLDFKNKIGSIGYWLAQDQQGKGIMTKAVHTLMTYGFQNLKLNRVEIRAAKENVSSQAIAKRLGFQHEGQIRQAEWLYDHYVDHVIYGMLLDDWLGIQNNF
jgi:ribosomal-protein-serine acetyltransferase